MIKILFWSSLDWYDKLLEQDVLITGSSNDIFEQINRAEYGAHYLLIHPELGMLRDIYSRYVKTQLEKNNEIVLITSYYETIDSVRWILSSRINANNYSIDIRKYENEGSLIIMDSAKAYFGLDDGGDDDNDSNDNGLPDKDGIMPFLKQLVKRAESSGKNGVSVFADIGSFYHYNSSNGNNSIDQLVEYELSLPSKYDMKLKGFCIYHKTDFDKRFTKEQRQKLLNHHDKRLLIIK